jgi:hypothetical protein
MFTLLTFQNCSITNLFQLIIIFLIVLNALPLEDMSEKKKNNKNLFFSSPIRKAASANDAKRVPLPASFCHTAYSLTKA